MLFCGIIVLAWIWEDAAVISGALIASDDLLQVPAALIAVFIGICSGDFALYGLGRLAHRWRKVRAWILLNPHSRRVSRKFRQKTITNIFIIRFIPGLRTVGFTLCGLWRISIQRFLIAMTVAGVVWIGLIFTLVYHLGESEFFSNTQWKWGLMLIALFLLIFNNIVSIKNSRRKKSPAKVGIADEKTV